MNFPSARAAIAALCLCALPAVATAQMSATADSTEARATARPVETLMLMAPDSSLNVRQSRPEIAMAARRREGLDRPTVLMIVGGALIVTGLLVGSDAAPILYLAGAGIGGYGLYLYLQSPTTRLVR